MEPIEAAPRKKPHPLLRFLLLALGAWILAWLPLGLAKGDLDYVLTAVSRDTIDRQIYQGLLYGGLLLVFIDSWRRHAPDRPARGNIPELLRYAGLGLLSAIMLRALTIALGGRPAPQLDLTPGVVVVAMLSALAVAGVEEAVFRGFLLGRLAASMPLSGAIVTSSLLFASVHLFRPGDLAFRAGYGLGLFLLAVLLARIAWVRQSVACSAGFHAGLVFPNLLDPWSGLQGNWWSGWREEPVSGALSWILTLLLWAQWEWWQSRHTENATVITAGDN